MKPVGPRLGGRILRKHRRLVGEIFSGDRRGQRQGVLNDVCTLSDDRDGCRTIAPDLRAASPNRLESSLPTVAPPSPIESRPADRERCRISWRALRACSRACRAMSSPDDSPLRQSLKFETCTQSTSGFNSERGCIRSMGCAHSNSAQRSSISQPIFRFGRSRAQRGDRRNPVDDVAHGTQPHHEHSLSRRIRACELFLHQGLQVLLGKRLAHGDRCTSARRFASGRE